MWRLDASKDSESPRHNFKRQVAPEWLVGADHRFGVGYEFYRSRSMFGINNRWEKTCERVEKRLSARHSCSHKHFWYRRRGPCAHRGSFRPLANPSAVYDPAWHDTGYIYIYIYMEGKPKKSIISDSVKVVLTCAKRHTEADAWAHVSTNAQALTKQWLKLRAKVDFLDVRPPTRIAGATDALQVLVFVPASA